MSKNQNLDNFFVPTNAPLDQKVYPVRRPPRATPTLGLLAPNGLTVRPQLIRYIYFLSLYFLFFIFFSFLYFLSYKDFLSSATFCSSPKGDCSLQKVFNKVCSYHLNYLLSSFWTYDIYNIVIKYVFL